MRPSLGDIEDEVELMVLGVYDAGNRFVRTFEVSFDNLDNWFENVIVPIGTRYDVRAWVTPDMEARREGVIEEIVLTFRVDGVDRRYTIDWDTEFNVKETSRGGYNLIS
jgi:hypothetical protein